MAINLLDEEQAAQQSINNILNLVLRQAASAALVDSPPGAGKTALVEDVAATACLYAQLRVGVIAANGTQTIEIIRRLVKHFPQLPIQILQSKDSVLPPDLALDPRIPRPVSKAKELRAGACVVVGTAHMFLVSDFDRNAFDLLICDEAYQIAARDFGPLYHTAQQHLLVGDPGQLPPLVQSKIDRFEAGPYKVHWAAPRELRGRIENVPVERLPISRRLPRDTVELIQPAFYPDHPFVSAARDVDRWVSFAPRMRQQRNPVPMRSFQRRRCVDNALDLLAGGASIVGLLLPRVALPMGSVDTELAELMAFVVSRLLQRGVTWSMRRTLEATDIGCLDAHARSVAEVQKSLRHQGLAGTEVRVDTPEKWQGSERPITVVKHPLSGLSRLSAFDLEPGRWCVMLSRHQLGCIIVGREGLDTALGEHNHDCATRPMGGDNLEWLGWNAHSTLWNELESRGRLVRVG